MSFDPIADMLTRIRNAKKAGSVEVSMPASNFKLALSQLLYKKGYLEDVAIFSEGNKRYLRLKLKYGENGNVAINEITQVSRQGQRIYAKRGSIPFVKNGLGISVISTSKGILTDREARKEKLGGEVICNVW